ncbi:MAG: bifunctional DNA-formamidopyrimidine glycosylase/DNA-(apurinic or apyrimidinic site) lyase [Notoacmeibacter sp.]
MPELPEVETVRRGLQPAVEGAVIAFAVVNRPNLRFPFPDRLVETIEGATVVSLERRAKYLLWHLDNGYSLIAHLGMSGSFRIEAAAQNTPGAFHFPRSAAKTHDHFEMVMQREGIGDTHVIYNDPRRFGFLLMTPTAKLMEHKLIKDIGLEPLNNSFDGDALFERYSGKSTSLKAALLDQNLIAGIGNIYACEALWNAKLSPLRKAGSLATKSGKKASFADQLANSIREVLLRAIEAGGSTLRDHRQANGELGYFQHSFSVYGRTGERCRHSTCSGTIERIVQNGRSTFFCAMCQK